MALSRILCGALLCGSPAAALAQSTTLISTSSAGVLSDGTSIYAELSADMRYVAWQSKATNLVLGDTNGFEDVFRREIATGITELVSYGNGGGLGDGDSLEPEISADGRFLVFFSYATNLVPGDTNNEPDIFVRDMQQGTTFCASLGTQGEPANGGNRYPTISHDGRFVAWESTASNLVPGDSNGQRDIFVRDTQLGLTTRVSVASSGTEGDGLSTDANVSADGRFVAYESESTNLVPGDTNGVFDCFLHDLQTATTVRVSTTATGGQSLLESNNPYASYDARYVVFDSRDSSFVPGDSNGQTDVFVKDMLTGAIERVSVDSSGVEADWDCYDAVITPDGLKVAYFSLAGNLVPGDTNLGEDVFFHDRTTGITERISVGAMGQEGNGVAFYPSLSPDGRFVGFDSQATNLVTGDLNAERDIFLRDRLGSFQNLCSGDGSLATACPCANTGAPGKGCDNSLLAGGAGLVASGTTLPDSVLLSASGEPGDVLSIFLQGDSLAAAGIVFGDGVRCVAGTLKRLYVKNAVAGSVSAPGAGEQPIHIVSALLGDPIPPGATRWYQVYYRDPDTGFCPSETFNATNGIRVGW